MRRLLLTTSRAITHSRPYRVLLTNVAVPPLLVLTLALAATVGAFMVARQNVHSTLQREAEQRAVLIEQRLQSRLSSQEQVLMGGTGRLESGPVDRQSWERFASVYNLPTGVPGMQFIGIAEVVPTANIATIEQRLSAEYGTTVRITPQRSDAESAAVISYVEPSSTGLLRAIGYNGFSDATRAATMRRSAAENTTTITGRIDLGGSANRGPYGLIMYRPYYDRSLPIDTADERMRAVRGYVFAVVTAGSGSTFDQMLAPELSDGVDLTVYVGETERSKIYEHKSSDGNAHVARLYHDFEQFGQTFQIEYGFTEDSLVAASQLGTPRFLLIAGLLASFLLSLMTYFLLHSRYERLAREKDREVQLAKDELLSLASHQLRTPATGVKQYLGMVVQGFAGKISKQQTELLQKAYESNDRQLRIINDILHLAKIDTGRIVLAKTTFDLSAMVKDVAAEQQGEADTGELTLEVKTPKRARYHGDEHMLRMVVENLLSNAIKYTPPGGTVTVRLRINPTNYKIAITDTGVGIDPSQQHRLFKQFSRIENKRASHVTGTGIGLYLAQHLVDLHKGSISVQSALDEGSTFTVTLPRMIL